METVVLSGAHQIWWAPGSVQSFAIIKNTALNTGILLWAFFTLELEVDYPSKTNLCTDTSSPHRQPFSDFFLGEGTAVHRLSETDNPYPNCRSKLTDKVRWIVHSKLKPFHFQTNTYYLSDANYQTDNPSHANHPSLGWKQPFLL